MNEELTAPEQTSDALDNDNDALNSAEIDDNDLAANNTAPTAFAAPTPPPAPQAPPAPPAPEFHLPAVNDIKQQVGDTATQAISQAKDSAGQALGVARKQVTDQLTTQKNRAADSLGGIKTSFQQIGDTFATNGVPVVGDYAHSLSDQVDKVAGYLRDSDLETLGRDAQAFARQNPAVVIGGAFLVGIALARFFKSSETNVQSTALVPVSTSTAAFNPTNVTPPTERQDVDLDEAFTPGVHPITGNGYVSGGVLGGAPA